MASSKPTNHKIHILISLVTFGLWLPIYLIIAFVNRGVKGDSVAEVKEKSKWQKMVEEANTLSAKNLGYKKGNWNSSQMYVLSCTHQIRARKTTKILSTGLLGKTVWCEVCNEGREVASAPYWVQ